MVHQLISVELSNNCAYNFIRNKKQQGKQSSTVNCFVKVQKHFAVKVHYVACAICG